MTPANWPPPTDATRLPHEWPTDTRDPLVCTHGCGAEPGDVLVEDECPRRLRAALAAAEGERDAALARVRELEAEVAALRGAASVTPDYQPEVCCDDLGCEGDCRSGRIVPADTALRGGGR